MPVRVKRKNVKYVARVDNTGPGDSKYRYFYTKEAYDAYLRGLHKTTADTTKPKHTATTEKKGFSLSGLFSGAAKKLQNDFSGAVNFGKNFCQYDREIYEENLQQSNRFWKNFVNGLSKTKTKFSESLVNAGKGFVDNLVNTTKEISNKVDKTAKEVSDKVVKDVIAKVNALPSIVDKVVNKVKEFGNKFYDDKNNIYDVNPSNYDEKIEKIKQTDEWKSIVARNDPEYTRYNEDGSVEYLIDDYVAKKETSIIRCSW